MSQQYLYKAKWLSQGFYYLVRRLLKSIGLSSITQSPASPILSIQEFLSQPEQFLLSLSCKALYPFRPRTSLVLENRRALLEVLQRSSPRFYYCAFCILLHPFDPQTALQNRVIIPYEVYTLGKCTARRGLNGSLELIRFNYDCELAFYHVQLVMNRHFFGPQHGVPLSALEYENKTSYRESGLTTSESWTARIINNELFLSATYILSHPGNAKEMRRAIDCGYRAICRHLTASESFNSNFSRMPQLWGFTEPSGSCKYCLADYTVQLNLREQHSQVTIITYHQLGTCRSPDDWMIKGFSRNMCRCTNSDRVRQGYKPGVVKEAWMKHFDT
jgi:hypothetical protein